MVDSRGFRGKANASNCPLHKYEIVDYNIRGAWFIHLTDADFGKAMPRSYKSQTNGL